MTPELVRATLLASDMDAAARRRRGLREGRPLHKSKCFGENHVFCRSFRDLFGAAMQDDERCQCHGLSYGEAASGSHFRIQYVRSNGSIVAEPMYSTKP